MKQKGPEKGTRVFECNLCDFKCFKNSRLERHFLTRKHKMKQNETKKGPKKDLELLEFDPPYESSSKLLENKSINSHDKLKKVPKGSKKDPHEKEKNVKANLKKVNPKGSKFLCMYCNKIFNSRSSLWRHNKICITKNVSSDMVIDILNENKELQKLLTEQQELNLKNQEEFLRRLDEQQKQMSDLIPKIGNTTNMNNFNLQVFLNEECKDALNWEEFIKSIKISSLNLKTEYPENADQTNYLTQILYSGIKDLSIYKRPMHCLDIKRKKVCIKDKNVWKHGDSDIKNTINEGMLDLRKKFEIFLQEWIKIHPNWADSEELTEEYMKIVSLEISVLDSQKFVGEIIKEIPIPKENNG